MTTTEEISPPPRTETPVLEAKGLVKRYGPVTAIADSDIELYPGEILAVIGDNGAGKSSLIKALSGALIPDEGVIKLEGREVRFANPMDARRAGIETVYQTLAVAPGWTSRTTCSSAANSASPGSSARCSACSTASTCATRPSGT